MELLLNVVVGCVGACVGFVACGVFRGKPDCRGCPWEEDRNREELLQVLARHHVSPGSRDGKEKLP